MAWRLHARFDRSMHFPFSRVGTQFDSAGVLDVHFFASFCIPFSIPTSRTPNPVHAPPSPSFSSTTMVAASKQDVDSTEDVHKPVLRKDSPSILALGKLFPQSKTLDHTVRFLSQVRGTDKTLMVGPGITTPSNLDIFFVLAFQGCMEKIGKIRGLHGPAGSVFN